MSNVAWLSRRRENSRSMWKLTTVSISATSVAGHSTHKLLLHYMLLVTKRQDDGGHFCSMYIFLYLLTLEHIENQENVTIAVF